MPLLLRLLLITLLVVNTTASAWAATGMAARMLPASDSAAMHHAGSSMVDMADMASDCHGPDADQPPMPCGNDSQHCDCLHACTVLPASFALRLPLIPRAGPYSVPAGGNPPPRLADPVRPPIAFHA